MKIKTKTIEYYDCSKEKCRHIEPRSARNCIQKSLDQQYVKLAKHKIVLRTLTTRIKTSELATQYGISDYTLHSYLKTVCTHIAKNFMEDERFLYDYKYNLTNVVQDTDFWVKRIKMRKLNINTKISELNNLLDYQEQG